MFGTGSVTGTRRRRLVVRAVVAAGRACAGSLAPVGEDDIRDRLEDHLRERAARPFGDVEAVSGRALQPFSLAGQRAAENLLTKARRALDKHDKASAATFIDRAVQLPFDEHEQMAPAAFAMHMNLFRAVTDAAEQASPKDSRWLDAAMQVLSRTTVPAACDLRDVLLAIDQDYALSQTEHRRIQAAVAPIPDRAELHDLALTTAELREHIMAILQAHRDYQHTLQGLTG